MVKHWGSCKVKRQRMDRWMDGCIFCVGCPDCAFTRTSVHLGFKSVKRTFLYPTTDLSEPVGEENGAEHSDTPQGDGRGRDPNDGAIIVNEKDTAPCV